MNATSFLATTGSGLARAGKDEQGTWSVEFVLGDQNVRCLAVDPNTSSVVYAGTQGNGVLRSEDRGKTWQPAGLQGHIIKALAVSKVESGVVYAGTKPPMLFVSRDRGEHWTELSAFRSLRRWFWRSPAEMPLTPYVQAIGLSPTDAEIIVVGIEAGAVVRSADGGKSWVGHRKGAVRDCHSLTFHAHQGDWVYEGGGTGAAFSLDAGQTWTQPRSSLDRRYVWACAADSQCPEVWYISASPFTLFGPPPAHIDGKANAYIFRSTAGSPWQKLTGGLPEPINYMAYALLTDPLSAGHLYAGLSNGDLWHSADYGDHWQIIPINLRGIHQTLVMF